MGATHRAWIAGAAALLALGPAAGALARPSGADLGLIVYLQRQAKLSAAVYSQVRAEVEDGRRPSADLEAARRSLKAAQEALYDKVEDTQRSNVALYGDLRRQNARRLRDEVALIRAEETELPTLAPAERPAAEARLALSRQVLEGYQANDLRLASPPAVSPRPKLPILPPRS